MMRNLFILFFLGLNTLHAQVNGEINLNDAPISNASNQSGEFIVQLQYKSPSLHTEQIIWGDIIPMDTPWPDDVHHAFKITLNKNARVGYERKNLLQAGTYTMQIIPHKDHWEYVFKDSQKQTVLTYSFKTFTTNWNERMLVYVEEPEPQNGMLIVKITWGHLAGSVFLYPQ